MNREIKFRIWDKESKYFFYTTFNRLCWQDDSRIDTKNIEVQEFTGLTDKNGKEIYVGDIISEHNKKYRKYENGEVIWSKEYLTYLSKKWNFNKTDDWSDFLYNLSGEREIEIIGNIFENPELLNK